MYLSPTKVIQLAVLSIFLFFYISCATDTDLLADAVLTRPDASIEIKDNVPEPLPDNQFIMKTVELSPVSDAYMEGNKGYNETIMRMEENNRTSYLMFDLSSISGEITDAALQFTVDSDEGSGIVNIYKGNSSNWSEKDLTIDNAPDLASQLGSIDANYTLGSTEKVALNTGDLKSEKTTLVLTHSQGNDFAFASKEYKGKTGPKLSITYMAPISSELENTGQTTSPDTSVPAPTTPAPTTPTTPTTPTPTTPTPTTPTPTTPEPTVPGPSETTPLESGYYVTVNGKAGSNGQSEATAWSIEYAFKTAKAGDVVYIKAGNYGNKQLIADNSGTASNPIKFIGYTNTPGDLVSDKGSTFTYGDQLDANKMPLIKGSLAPDIMGIDIQENYVEIQNFQIQGYEFGIITTGNHVTLKNIITYESGHQTVNSGSGKGIILYGNDGTIENCFDYNSTSQGITLSGSINSSINYCQVYSDNKINPGGYYILLTGGTKNSLVDNSVVYRDKDADLHRGHGFILKDQATNNTIRNSTAYNTGIEVNFTGVYSNNFENMKIHGSYSSDNSEFSSDIRVINGAHDNTFKNIQIQDCRYAINFHDFDDGYVGPGGDRDAFEGGSNNKFINLQVDKAKNIIGSTSPEVGKKAFSNNNIFSDCTFKNITQKPFFSYQTMKNTKFINCNFQDIPSNLMTQDYDGGSLPIVFENCLFSNVGFPIPK